MKKFYFSLGLMLILVMPLVLAEVSLEGLLSGITNFVTNYEGYKDAYNVLFLSILLIAAFTIGVKSMAAKRGWGGSVTNAVTAIGIILGIGGAFGAHYSLKGLGFYVLDFFGPFALLVAIAVLMLAIASLFFRQNQSFSNPYFIAIAVILLYYFLNAFFPNFSDKLGNFGWIIEVIFFIAFAYLLFGLVMYVLHLFTGLKPLTPLGGAEFRGTKTAIKQKREIESEIAISKARKEERKTRRGIRYTDRYLNEAKRILGELHEAVAKKDFKLISGKAKFSQGKLKELEGLKVKIGGQVGLITKVLAEFETEMEPADKSKLGIFERRLLVNVKTLEKHIAEITANVHQIDKSTPTGDRFWLDTLKAVEDASNILGNIHTTLLGALALEQKVRGELGRE